MKITETQLRKLIRKVILKEFTSGGTGLAGRKLHKGRKSTALQTAEKGATDAKKAMEKALKEKEAARAERDTEKTARDTKRTTFTSKDTIYTTKGSKYTVDNTDWKSKVTTYDSKVSDDTAATKALSDHRKAEPERYASYEWSPKEFKKGKKPPTYQDFLLIQKMDHGPRAMEKYQNEFYIRGNKLTPQKLPTEAPRREGLVTALTFRKDVTSGLNPAHLTWTNEDKAKELAATNATKAMNTAKTQMDAAKVKADAALAAREAAWTAREEARIAKEEKEALYNTKLSNFATKSTKYDTEVAREDTARQKFNRRVEQDQERQQTTEKPPTVGAASGRAAAGKGKGKGRGKGKKKKFN